MDQQNSMRWSETLKAEKRCKANWMEKYLTEEEQLRELEAEQAVQAELMAAAPATRKGRSERDCMELRLAGDDVNAEPSKPPPPPPSYEIARQRVAAEVAATRQRSHRVTGDLSTESMLRDIGPGLWTSINPGYNQHMMTSSMQTTHIYNKSKGWMDKVDKMHNLRRDPVNQHAEKALQLGEKVFVSGGMKGGGK